MNNNQKIDQMSINEITLQKCNNYTRLVANKYFNNKK